MSNSLTTHYSRSLVIGMKVTQEKLPASQVSLEIEVPGERCKQVYEQTIQKLAREVRIPGFRKGKVPRQILIQRLGSNHIKASALEQLLDDTLKQVVKQEEIKAIGNYKLVSSFEELVNQFQPGQILTFSASVDVLPHITLKQYQDLSLQAEEVEYDPEKIDNVLERYRKQLATLIPVEGRAAQFGDVATIDLDGYFQQNEATEPKPVPEGSGRDVQVELEAGQLVPGLVEGILGMEPEQTKEIPVTFPQAYPQEELAGRPATFTVTLKDLKERELPELNDDFAKEISDAKTLADLRETLEKRFREEAAQKSKSYKEAAIFRVLREQVEGEIPETLIAAEGKQLINQTLVRLNQQGVDVNKLVNEEHLREMQQHMRPQAIESVKQTLAIGYIAEQQSIEAEQSEIARRSKDLIAEVEDTSQIDLQRLKDMVTEDILREKVLEWFEEHNTIERVSEGTLESHNQDPAESVDAMPPLETADELANLNSSEPLSQPDAVIAAD